MLKEHFGSIMDAVSHVELLICGYFRETEKEFKEQALSIKIPETLTDLVIAFYCLKYVGLDGYSRYIRHYYLAVEKEDYKLETLYDLYECLSVTKSIIYCNTYKKVMWLRDKMKKKDFMVRAITERECFMTEYYSGCNGVFIISDDLGVELAQLNGFCAMPLVINYDLPLKEENYSLHISLFIRRLGTGVVINFVEDDEEPDMRSIERFYNIRLDELPMEVASIMY